VDVVPERRAAGGDLAESLLRLDVVEQRLAERLPAPDHLPERGRLKRRHELLVGVRVLERLPGDALRVPVLGLAGGGDRLPRLGLILAGGLPALTERVEALPLRGSHWSSVCLCWLRLRLGLKWVASGVILGPRRER
jgi:hypothetical protein